MNTLATDVVNYKCEKVLPSKHLVFCRHSTGRLNSWKFCPETECQAIEKREKQSKLYTSVEVFLIFSEQYNVHGLFILTLAAFTLLIFVRSMLILKINDRWKQNRSLTWTVAVP